MNRVIDVWFIDSIFKLPIDFHDLLDSWQGGNHAQPQICCDLPETQHWRADDLSHDRHLCTARCGAPYQAEHQPAHFCDCLKAGFNDVQCMITAMDIARKHLERLTSTSVLSNYKMNLELLVYEEFLQLKIKSVQRQRQMFCYQWQSTRSKAFPDTKLENQRQYGFVWGMYHHFCQLLADVCHDGKRHSGGGCRQGGMHWHSSLAVLVGFFLICCGLRDVADLQICARLGQKLMSQVAFTEHTEMIWDHWRPRSNIYRNLSSSCCWGDVFRNLAPREPWQEVSIYWPFAKPYWMQSFAAKEHHSPGLFSLDRHTAKLVLLEMFLCPDTRESGIAGRLSNRFWRRCLQYAYQHIGKTRQGWNKVAYKGLVKELSLCWWISKVKPKGFIWFHYLLFFQAFILLMWAHLWTVPTMSGLACALVSYTNAQFKHGHSVIWLQL